MKKSIFALLALCLFAGSAMAVDSNQKKCFGKMHICFKDNTDLVIDLNPTELYQCLQACSKRWTPVAGQG